MIGRESWRPSSLIRYADDVSPDGGDDARDRRFRDASVHDEEFESGFGVTDSGAEVQKTVIGQRHNLGLLANVRTIQGQCRVIVITEAQLKHQQPSATSRLTLEKTLSRIASAVCIPEISTKVNCSLSVVTCSNTF